MISYAQNQEDVFLARVFGLESAGFYIDIGACHPTIDSVTKHFYDQGWTGINVEPVPQMFEKLQSARPRDINLNLAVSNTPGETQLHICPDALVLSTLAQDVASEINEAGVKTETVTIEAKPLKQIVADHIAEEQTVHFMKIDVEGHEKEVIESIDFEQCRPQVLLIEATKPRTRITNHDNWEPLVLAADYEFANFDGLNRYYVRHENKELVEPLSQPISCFDKYFRYAQVVQFNWMRHQMQNALASDDPAQVAKILEFMSALEKSPQWLVESPAFLGSRLTEFLNAPKS